MKEETSFSLNLLEMPEEGLPSCSLIGDANKQELT